MQSPVAQAVAVETAAQQVLERALSLLFLSYCFQLRRMLEVGEKVRWWADGPSPGRSEREESRCAGPLPLPHSLIAQADSASWVDSCWKICARRYPSSAMVVAVVIVHGTVLGSVVLQAESEVVNVVSVVKAEDGAWPQAAETR